MTVPPKHFLTDTTPLAGGNAVAALIVSDDNRYLLQLRDDVPGIFYPGHWGCFGGAMSPDELPQQCLMRELHEELEWTASDVREFIRFDFDLARAGSQKLFRIYFEVMATKDMISRFVLHEGADMQLFTPEEIFDRLNITPYDFVRTLDLHGAAETPLGL